MAKLANKPSVGYDYAKEWVSNNENLRGNRLAIAEGQYELGLATCLHLVCMDVFKTLCRENLQSNLSRLGPGEARLEARALKQQLGKFHLWAKVIVIETWKRQ